jgi:tetratricopeptide (TPR) repeat protein
MMRSGYISSIRLGLSLGLLLLLVACAATDSTGRSDSSPLKVDTSLSPYENLVRFAQYEQASQIDALRDVPTPPGIDPRRVSRPMEVDAGATMPLKQVLVELAAKAPVPTAQVPAPPLDADDEDAAARHYIRAREAALSNRHMVAITEFNRALEYDPNSIELFRGLARSHTAIGNTTRAAQYYERLRSLKPHDSEATLGRVLHAADAQDYETAAALLARWRVERREFDHDQGAAVLAEFVQFNALRSLGYDLAALETARSLAELQGLSIEHTLYVQPLTALYRGQGELWQAVGDIHCRLDEFEQALDAYAVSMRYGTTNPEAMHPRLVYANVRLGRVYTAQLHLADSWQADSTSISDRDIQLGRYLAEHGQPIELLAQHVRAMYQAHLDNAEFARLAATLLSSDDALNLLREFVDRQPRDLHVVGQLLGWVVREEPRAAIQLTAELIDQHPDLSSEYIGKLAFASPNPVALVSALQTMPSSAILENVHARLLGLLGAIGDAWNQVQHGRELYDDYEPLATLQIELIALLEEPSLLDGVLAETQSFAGPMMWLTRSRAFRAAGRAEEALDAAERAAALADNHPRLQNRVHVELARAHVAVAQQQEHAEDRRKWGRAAAEITEQILHEDPLLDDAYELLLNIYGPNGPAQDANQFRIVARRLFEANPDRSLYIRLSADEAMRHGRYEQARERLLGLYESDPSDTRSLRLIVNSWVREGQLDAALNWVNQHLDARPGDPVLLEAWVELMMRSERSDEVVLVLQQQLEQSQDEPYVALPLLETVYRLTRQPEKAFALGEDRLLKRPQGPRREVELAALYGGAGMQRMAVQRIEWLVDAADQATLDHLSTAVAILSRLDTSDGIDRLMQRLVDTTVAIYPDSPLQVYASGLLAISRLGDDGHAMDALMLRATRHARGASGPTPQHALPWRDLAQALVEQDEAALAARVLALRTLSDAPMEQETLDLLATLVVVADAASYDGEPAAITLRMLHELDAQERLPRLMGMQGKITHLDTLYQASQIFTFLGHDAGTEMLLRELIEHDAEHAMAMNNLGYMRIENGHDDAETAAMIERASKLEPDDPSILDTIGWLRYKQGMMSGEHGAAALISQAVSLSDDPSAEVLDHLGDALWRLGEQQEAIEHWQQAVAVLQRADERQRIEENYLLIQTRGWGLLVADPQVLYHRDYGSRLESLQHKLHAAEHGEQPPLARTFEELDDDTASEP